MRSLDQFIADNNVTATVRETEPNAAWFGPRDTGTSWKVTFRANGRSMTVPFHQGSAITSQPTREDVLSTLALDATGVHNVDRFEDWAEEYGLDTDSRDAEKTYKAVRRQTESLRRLLGDEEYRALVEDTHHEPGDEDEQDEETSGCCEAADEWHVCQSIDGPAEQSEDACCERGAETDGEEHTPGWCDAETTDDYREATPREASAYLAGHRSFPGAVETEHGLMIPTDGQER